MKNILIIEDDPLVGSMYRNKLSSEGYQVEVARDGEAGWDLLHSYRPLAVILDLLIPKISGLDLLRKLRSEPEFKHLPVLVLSNTYLSSMIEEAWKAGATKCFLKLNSPPKQVIEALNSILASTPAPASSGPGTPSPAMPLSALQAAKPPAPAPHPVNSPGEVDPDEAFRSSLRRTFLEGFPAALKELRTQTQEMLRAVGEIPRLRHIFELNRRVHGLASNASVCGFSQIALVADAFEALLRELYESPQKINVSTLRTTVSVADMLDRLLRQGNPSDDECCQRALILVVDDDKISRLAVNRALDKVRLRSVSVSSPDVALALLSENKFDLIFLDVAMPGMNGYDLCAKLRNLPGHRKTPVVFVTALDDLDHRIDTARVGGSDFIAKPFLFTELALKSLAHILAPTIGDQPQSPQKADLPLAEGSESLQELPAR